MALDISIDTYGKAFLLKNDYYNGINHAYLLNVRAAQSPPAEAVADFVLAQRVRRKVIAICDALLAGGPPQEETYWILATLAEAWLGLGERDKSAEALDEPRRSPNPNGCKPLPPINSAVCKSRWRIRRWSVRA